MILVSVPKGKEHLIKSEKTAVFKWNKNKQVNSC